MRDRLQKLQQLDFRLLVAMRTRGHSPRLDAAGEALDRVGAHARIWVVIGLVLTAVDPSRWESWLFCAALGPAAIGFNYLIKVWVRRPRPKLEELGLKPLGKAPSSLSFPSAHATSSFAVATAMCWVDPATSATFVVALAIALDRPYLGMHFPSDVLAGAILGVALGMGVGYFLSTTF